MHRSKNSQPRWSIAGLGAASAAMLMAVFLTPCSAQAEAQTRRVAAAGGVITEIAYALGRQDWLVGVDSTSQFPPDALKAKPNIGYVRALSAEGLLSLKPDVVIAIEGAGPPDVLKLIEQARVPIRFIPEDYSEAGVLKRIRAVGEVLDASAEAEALARTVQNSFEALARSRAQMGVRARVMFVLSLQNGRVMVGGRNTSADAIIRLAGAENAAQMVEGFKPLSDEGIIAAAPDVIVMMKRGDHAISPAELFAQPAFRLVPAAKSEALVAMDGLYLLGFGPRTPAAAQDLMQEIERAQTPRSGKQATRSDPVAAP
jgi:iron complex transport system substrate-binding protein